MTLGGNGCCHYHRARPVLTPHRSQQGSTLAQTPPLPTAPPFHLLHYCSVTEPSHTQYTGEELSAAAMTTILSFSLDRFGNLVQHLTGTTRLGWRRKNTPRLASRRPAETTVFFASRSEESLSIRKAKVTDVKAGRRAQFSVILSHVLIRCASSPQLHSL